MDRPVIIFVAVVTVISVIIAVLLLVLFIQRRRQRALLMLAIAQEEADRRRRKRRKAGLRRREIDLACPEALVSEITSASTTVKVFSVDANPTEYAAAVRSLRAAGLISPDAPVLDHAPNELADAPAVSVEELDLPSAPPALSREEKADAPQVAPALPIKSEAASEQADDVPPQVLVLPESQETCVICLDDITVGTRVRSLPCAHVYHSQCIRVWLRRKNACPCCCVKVIKRRKKRSRATDEPVQDPSAAIEQRDTTDVGHDPTASESARNSASPRSPSPVPASHPVPVLFDDDDLFQYSHQRPEDRCEDVTLDMTESRPKSAALPADRPRVQGTAQPQSSFARNVSFIDPEDPNSDYFASEASSSHLDEPSAAELLYQVRRELRGESSAISLNTSIDDASEMFSEQGTLPDIKFDADAASLNRDFDLFKFSEVDDSSRLQDTPDGAENAGPTLPSRDY